VTQPDATSDVLNCSHDSHRSRCEHVTAVRVHLDGFCPELGNDDTDDLNAAEVGLSPVSPIEFRFKPYNAVSVKLTQLQVSFLTACTGSGCL